MLISACLPRLQFSPKHRCASLNASHRRIGNTTHASQVNYYYYLQLKKVTKIMDDRVLDLTEEQKATKAKYPPITKKYEYLDHTADVQIHSWGNSLEEAFEQCAMGMFGYMTDTETVEPLDTVDVESEGEDMESLLYHFLDDWLYKFCADLFFVPREIKVLSIDRMRFRIRSIGWGEEFSLEKHPQGTEVKAITYSAMQIHDKEKPEIFAIVDI